MTFDNSRVFKCFLVLVSVEIILGSYGASSAGLREVHTRFFASHCSAVILQSALRKPDSGEIEWSSAVKPWSVRDQFFVMGLAISKTVFESFSDVLICYSG